MSSLILYAIAGLAFFAYAMREDRPSWTQFGYALFLGAFWLPMIIWSAIAPEAE